MKNKIAKKIIYVDMDGVLCDYDKAYDDAIKNNPSVSHPQSQVDFFRKLEPLENAIESFQFLNNQALFDVYILTSPSIKNPLCYLEKRLWIEDYLGIETTRKLIISPNKGLLKGDFLIDDMVNGKWQENFEGQLIQFGSSQYPNWQSIIIMFKTKFEII